MEKETEFKQKLLLRTDKICRCSEAIVVCTLLILSTLLDLYDVRIDFGGSHTAKMAVFIVITGQFIVSNVIRVYLKLLCSGFSVWKLVWNLTISWSMNVFILCCVHVYIFDSNFAKILPIAVSAAICTGGMQGIFHSLGYMLSCRDIRNRRNMN